MLNIVDKYLHYLAFLINLVVPFLVKDVVVFLEDGTVLCLEDWDRYSLEDLEGIKGCTCRIQFCSFIKVWDRLLAISPVPEKSFSSKDLSVYVGAKALLKQEYDLNVE